MDSLLLFLSFATLALVYLSRRKADKAMGELKSALESGEGAREIADRLETLEQLVLQLDPEPARQELARLRSNLSQLLEAPPTPEPLPSDPELPRPHEVRGIVERYLRGTGCDQIQLLSSDSELDAEDVEVRVEAMNQGLCIKGRVHVVGTEIREVGFDNTHKLFP